MFTTLLYYLHYLFTLNLLKQKKLTGKEFKAIDIFQTIIENIL